MPTIYFTKINGAGNDFILIDKNKNTSLKITPELTRKICDRRKGIGADGVLVINPNKTYDFELEYFNADGSTGTLCGNGARCSIKYFLENYSNKKKETRFLCNNEIFEGKAISSENIIFYLKDAEDIKLDIAVNLNNQKIIGDFLNTGSPHFVINWENISKFISGTFRNFDVKELGKKIRFAKEFKPEGTNVNFIKLTNKKNYIRTYERGVENETLACGTGTVAAAIIVSLKTKKELPIEFITFGGDKLKVDYHKINEKKRKISLTGPAKINYIGTYNY
jgi:diaminopimelate epimerase